MKKQALIRFLRGIARGRGVNLHLLWQGRHEVWQFGEERLVIPRHTEIDEHTTRAILKKAQESSGSSNGRHSNPR